MKECCKSDSQATENKSNIKKWFNYIVYIILFLIVGGAFVLQLFS
jgi:hypothetical protein